MCIVLSKYKLLVISSIGSNLNHIHDEGIPLLLYQMFITILNLINIEKRAISLFHIQQSQDFQ